MTLVIQRADLARLLGATVKVVEARHTIEILSTVRLIAADDLLTVTATDLDIEVASSAPCSGAISVCVDANLLAGIVAKAAGADVSLSLAEATLTVKSGRSVFKLQTLPVEDFPSFTTVDFTAEFEADLAALFAPLQFAISTEETRFYLNGIYMHVKDGSLTAVATDGHRLARNMGMASDEFEGIIVPRKACGLVPKGSVAVSLSTTKIRFVADDTTITSKLIDGTFPDYERILPRNNEKLVTFSSPEMRQAVERVSIVSSERGRAVKLNIDVGTVTLAVNNPDQGSASEEIAVTYAGEPVEIGFNSAYMAELIAQFPAGDITMALHDGGSPTLFTSEKAPGLLAVLMPVRM